MRFVFPFLWLLTCAHAAPPTAGTLKVIAERYLAKSPLPLIERGFDMDEGLRTQQAFVRLLSPELGPVAGYKIGLITKANQERLGATGPVYGALLRKMLLKDGSVVHTNFGARPALELDLGVIVKDEAVNEAVTASQIARHLSHLVCFIELVDSITQTNQPMDAALLTALNVGARAGILGDRRKMTPELAAALPEMKFVLATDGKITATVEKLGLQPLENIRGLAATLKAQGKKLKRGDFISLGSPAGPQAIAPGTTRLRYENLPGGPMEATVEVSAASR